MYREEKLIKDIVKELKNIRDKEDKENLRRGPPEKSIVEAFASRAKEQD